MATQNTVKPGDVTQRVSVEVILARGVDVEKLIKMLVANAAADFGKDHGTYEMAARSLNEEIEHEVWFIELLAHERDGKSIPSGHFRRGEPGEAPYSKNRRFYIP